MKNILAQFKKNIAAFMEMARIESGSSYFRKALQQYPDYANDQVTIPGKFTYANPSEPSLAELRETHHLKQVAGDGDEISKILNLMRWVHNTITWDGMSKNPEPCNAMNIIKVCREQKRGVNCRMMATVLNEVYLSMGFLSRHVTCNPQKYIIDCHVINMVYHKEMGKWLYIDPAFGAYFQDVNGKYLSIQEVRESLISNNVPIVNNDMNYNGKQHWCRKKRYVTYMTKNLFRFSCPLHSEYNYESASRDRIYVHLDPRNFRRDTQSKTGKDSHGNQVTHHFISNPSFFWVIPKTD